MQTQTTFEKCGPAVTNTTVPVLGFIIYGLAACADERKEKHAALKLEVAALGKLRRAFKKHLGPIETELPAAA